MIGLEDPIMRRRSRPFRDALDCHDPLNFLLAFVSRLCLTIYICFQNFWHSYGISLTGSPLNEQPFVRVKVTLHVYPLLVIGRTNVTNKPVFLPRPRKGGHYVNPGESEKTRENHRGNESPRITGVVVKLSSGGPCT